MAIELARYTAKHQYEARVRPESNTTGMEILRGQSTDETTTWSGRVYDFSVGPLAEGSLVMQRTAGRAHEGRFSHWLRRTTGIGEVAVVTDVQVGERGRRHGLAGALLYTALQGMHGKTRVDFTPDSGNEVAHAWATAVGMEAVEQDGATMYRGLAGAIRKTLVNGYPKLAEGTLLGPWGKMWEGIEAEAHHQMAAAAAMEYGVHILEKQRVAEQRQAAAPFN